MIKSSHLGTINSYVTKCHTHLVGEYTEATSDPAGPRGAWCRQMHWPWVLERGAARLCLLQQRVYPETRRGHHALAERRERAATET